MKFNLLIITLFIFSVSNAQIKKGNLFIGGDVYLSISNATNINANNENTHSSSFGFSPSIGWVTKDNLVVGATILTNFTNNEYSPYGSNKSYRIGAGIWMRKYLPIGKSFYLFGNGMLAAQPVYSYNSNSTQPGNKERGFSINVNVVPGIAYQVNKGLFLEAALNNLFSLGYTKTNIEYQNANNINSKGVTNSFVLSSGIGSSAPLQVGVRWMIVRN